MTADQHLLFGLLALQNGLIDQGQLVAAFQAWTLDKSRSLADHLGARGDLTGARRAAIEVLAAIHIEAHDGDVEKSLAAVPANPSTRAGLATLGEPEIIRNFAYDHQAYGTVKRNLSQLVASGQLRPAMELALELMKRGSYQVEISDEGLTEDIEGCLSVIIEALGKSNLSRDEVTAWSLAMLASDRVGFIADEALQTLRNQRTRTAGGSGEAANDS
jgi:hypothetical protein